MTPPLSIDDEVEIIGVRCDGQAERMGERFRISQYHADQNGERCSAIGFPWYPASSLRLVEELKIGDWVQVIGQSLFCNRQHENEMFQIKHINNDGEISYNHGELLYPAKSLRKLAPEEIERHLAKDLPGTSVEGTIMDRLSAIEKRLDAQKDAIIEMGLRLDVDGEAIKVLEGERPEVIDCDSLPSFLVAKEADGGIRVKYSRGGIALAAMVLDGMREG